MNEAMEWLFASGHAVDVVLSVLVAEAIILRARGHDLRPIVLTVLPAILILIGLRAALTGMDWPWIAVPVALSFPVHLADLAARFGPRRQSD